MGDEKDFWMLAFFVLLIVFIIFIGVLCYEKGKSEDAWFQCHDGRMKYQGGSIIRYDGVLFERVWEDKVLCEYELNKLKGELLGGD